MTRKYDDGFVILMNDDLKPIYNEGYWTLYYKDRYDKLENICQKILTKKIVQKCGYLHKTQQKDTPQILRFYLNGKDVIQQRKLLSYLIQRQLIKKIRDKRYPNMVFKFKDNENAEFLSNWVNLTTGSWE